MSRKKTATTRKKAAVVTKTKSRSPSLPKATKRLRTAPEVPEAASVPTIDLQSLKVAIVCDWLTGAGGAERVVLELHKLFPAAPIYTSQYDKNPKIWYGGSWFKDADVRTTWLQHLPKRLKKFLPVLRARSFAQLDLSDYDLVLVSSGSEAKAVKVGRRTTLIWYCHAPTHYYWSRYDEYMKHPGFGLLNPLARLGLFLLVRPLRRWDYAAAQRPNYIITNSNHTRQAIKKYYGREATVVYPPVDIDRFKSLVDNDSSVRRRTGRSAVERFGFVTAGRQTPYKRIDLAVEACSRLNLPLTVIGTGPEHTKLTAMAGQSVRFLTSVTDAEMAHYFNLANAFIFPGVDDFGIVAVEALSAGTPVIAYQAGGALDYIQPGVTGSFFAEPTVTSLMQALRSFQAESFNRATTAQAAEQYAVEHFADRMIQTIAEAMQNHPTADAFAEQQYVDYSSKTVAPSKLTVDVVIHSYRP